MGIAKGTKLKYNPKDRIFRLRLDNNTAQKLEHLAAFENVSKSEIVRRGIDLQFSQKSKK